MTHEHSPEIQSPNSSRIIDVVRDDPGCNIAQAQERSGLGRHGFQNALDEATRAGVIHRVPHGRETLLFPDHDDIHIVVPQLTALRDPYTLGLYQYLYGEHEVSDRQILVQYAETEWGLDEDGLRWRLRGLEEAGLLQAFYDWQDRRQIKYRCLPAHPFVLRRIQQTNEQ